MDPLAIHKKFVLVLSFWKVQDSNKVIVAVQREDVQQHHPVDALNAALPWGPRNQHCSAPLPQHLHAGLGLLIISDPRHE